MCAFVFVLILANLLFLAWTQGFLGSPSGPDALRLKQQLLADRMTIVSRDTPPGGLAAAEKAAPAVDKKAASACLRVGDLKLADVARFEAALAGKSPDLKVVRFLAESGSNYWVFIPPQDSKRDADKKASELKELHVDDFFIVQDEGPNRFAISLGIFSTKTAAESHLAGLRKKGVRSARVGERSAKPSVAALEITGPKSQFDVLRKLLADTLPENRPDACKAPAGGQ